MASLLVLNAKLATAVANGDEVAIKRLRKEIEQERKRRGKRNPKQGL